MMSSNSSTPATENVVVTFLLDGIAQEDTETYTLRLVPSNNTSLPNGASIFFRDEIRLVITDNDGW